MTLQAFRDEIRQPSAIGDGDNRHGLRRFVYPIDDIEVADGELSAIEGGKHGIPRERIAIGHFRK